MDYDRLLEENHSPSFNHSNHSSDSYSGGFRNPTSSEKPLFLAGLMMTRF
jgi:hypothetical protein